MTVREKIDYCYVRMLVSLINYLKHIILIFPLLLSAHIVLAQQPFCDIKTVEETEPSLLQKFEENSHKELTDYYDKLVRDKMMSEEEKTEELKQYENPEIKVCPNPHNTSQKIVYIEYEKHQRGLLYFTVVEGNNILKWIEIEAYGATIQYVQWDETGFFYEDSIPGGTRTQNICSFKENFLDCKEIRRYHK